MRNKWLTFQLLCAVCQLHSKAVTHGDIKPENILLTSYNWLFLTDFISVPRVYSVSGKEEKEPRWIDYKPTYIEESSWNLYNMFFGAMDNNKRWYIAPERLISKADFFARTYDSYLVQPSMDIFSVGWVIAEIFLDGKPLFDLARHQLYRKNQFNPRDILCMIDDEDIEALIMDMISLDPQNRKSISTYLFEWMKTVFPQSFSSIFFQLGAVIHREHMLSSDKRIAMIRKYIDASWMACFGEEIDKQELIVPTNMEIFDQLKYENFPNIIHTLVPDFDCIITHKNNGEREIMPIEFTSIKTKNNASDSMLVLVSIIGTLIHSSKNPDTKLLALEMLKAIGRQIREEFRLQYIVPYCIFCFSDSVSKVKVEAIDCFIEVLKDVESIEIGHTDYYVFDTYIFPAFYKLLEDSDIVINIKLIEVLPHLITIGKTLITSVNMHKQKITMLTKDEALIQEPVQMDREEVLFARLQQAPQEEPSESKEETKEETSVELTTDAEVETRRDHDDSEEETIVTSREEI